MQPITTRHSGEQSPPASASHPPDLRQFWRTLLAIVAPLPWLALALSNAVTPDDLGSTTAETFASISENPSAARAALWLGLVFSLLVVPSGVAMMMAHRRISPRLTLAIGGFTTYAFYSTLVNPNLNLIGLITHEQGLDSETTIALASSLEEHPLTIIAIIPFFLTITLGRIGLGVLLWRARSAPRAVAIAMLAASPVEFLFVGASIGQNIGPALSYVLTAIGFSGASIALLRMTDDDFDLAPCPGLNESGDSPDKAGSQTLVSGTTQRIG